MARAQLGVGADVPDAGQRTGGDDRRQGGTEDEARGVAAHEVDQGGRGRDIAADHAKALGQSTLDDVDPVHDTVTLGDAGTVGPVESDGMDLVEVGERAELGRGVADLGDRPDIAVHRVDRLEGDDLRCGGVRAGQQLAQVRHVVVAEHAAGSAAVADAGDHRGVVQRVGEHQAAGQAGGQGRERRLVGDVARGEDQGRVLAMQAGQFALQLDMQVVGAGDVARAAGAGALRRHRVTHGLEHQGVAAHAEVVIAAPDHDLARGAHRRPVQGQRIAAGQPLQVGEHAIAALAAQPAQRVAEEPLVVEPHGDLPAAACLHGTRSLPSTTLFCQ